MWFIRESLLNKTSSYIPKTGLLALIQKDKKDKKDKKIVLVPYMKDML